MSEKQYVDAVSLIKEIIEKWCPKHFLIDTLSNRIIRSAFELNAYVLDVERIIKGEDPVRTHYPQDLPSKAHPLEVTHLNVKIQELESTLQLAQTCMSTQAANALTSLEDGDEQECIDILKSMSGDNKPGTEEGATCNRNDCQGILIYHIDNCSCHTGNPPCSACTDSKLVCLICGWEEDEN